MVIRGAAAAPLYQAALTSAQQGIAADANNPLHYYLAAQAYAGMNDLTNADAMWTKAEQLCSGLAGDINPARKQAWATSFQAGIDALQRNDTASALAAWQRAAAVWNRAPETYLNMGVLYTAQNDNDRAVASFRETLAALRRAEPDTSTAVRNALAETKANAMAGLLNAGAKLFQAEKFAESGEIFRFLTTQDPNNRDAWYNAALAYYKLNRWNDLLPIAQHLVDVDPLNYNGRIILFNAYKGLATGAQEKAMRDQALATLTAAEALPVKMTSMQVANTADKATLTGTLEGSAARAGAPIALDVTFYGANGALGTQTVTVAAPAKGAHANFEVSINTTSPVTGVSYKVR
jgi:tetratricopeptide (TPR) repeat protein